MATCSTANCTCKNFYTDWAIGQRTGSCEDCGHLKTEHSREQQIPAPAPGISAEMKKELRDIAREEAYELVEKRLRQSSTPGKGDAVFLLHFNGQFTGSCFAIDDSHVMSARHNMYDDTADYGINDTAELVSSFVVPSTNSAAPITVKISACTNPPKGGSIANSDDWIVLERTDGGKFRITIPVEQTTESDLTTRRPFVTIYHFPVSLQIVEKFSHTLHSISNRVIGADNGELRCNEISLISKGSCGGPYVDNDRLTAVGFHIAGASSFEGKANKFADAINNVPVGLHFEPASTVVTALKSLKILP